MIDSTLNLLSSKMARDEFYTLLMGFGFGLLYFLTIITKPGSLPNELEFYIMPTFYAALFLIASCLLLTLINYIVYGLLMKFILWQARRSKGIAEEKREIEKIGIIDLNNLAEYQVRYVHILVHLVTVILLLAPYPWLLFHLHVTVEHPLFCSIIWSVGIVLMSWIFKMLIFKRIVYYAAVDELLNDKRVNITRDPQQVIDAFNTIVDKASAKSP